MTQATASFSDADLRLIESDYRTLPELCAEREVEAGEVEQLVRAGVMPQPAYSLPDGRRMFPEDYFQLADVAGGADRMRSYFLRRFEAAARVADLDFTDDWNPESEWTDYIDGTYWVCLRNVTPEVIVEKERQIRKIVALDRDPRPEAQEWCAELRTAVDALDAIERPFTDFDRARWDYTSRDRYITAIRERYPEAFPPVGR